MNVLIKKWGNSASVMAAAKLSLNQAVDVREEQGRIIVEPIRSQDDDLVKLIAGITGENRHEEVVFGRPEGKEKL
jgi:antitoxin MazE